MNKNTLKKIIIILALGLLLSLINNAILSRKLSKARQEQSIEQVNLELDLYKLALDKEQVLNQLENNDLAIKQAINEISTLKRKCAYSLAGVDYE